MRLPARIGPLLLALTMLAACAGGGETPPPDTGLMLQIMVGPSCPAVRQDEPCPDQPLSAEFRILDQNGLVAAEGETDERGWAAVPLSPGVYLVEPLREAPAVPPTPPGSAEFSVEAGRWTEVRLLYDSGIR